MKVLITGGSSGIGRAAAEILLEEDHEVYVFDKDDPDFDPTKFFGGDVRDEDFVESVLEDLELDVLVNCAGFYELGSLEDMSRDVAEKIFDTNVHGYLNFIRHSLPILRERSGRVVNVSSVAGRVSMPYFGAYCSSKHAVESLCDSLRRESDVEVVVVEPGVVETGFNERARNALEKYIPGSFYSSDYEEILDRGGLDGIKSKEAGKSVVRAVTSDRPGRRIQVPLRAKFFVWLSIAPHFLKDKLFKKFSS